MKFRFKLQSVLKHRLRLRDEAQREHMAAKAKVDDCLAEIQKMYDQMDQARNLIAASEKTGTKGQAAVFSSSHEFLSGQKVKIERRREEARQLMAVAEQKLEVLIEASKEYEALKNLKKRRFEEFKKQKTKKENSEIDDLVTMRFNRSGT